MTDFYQNGVITTLHHLRHRSLQSIEDELVNFSKESPMALILPCLYSELEGPALRGILEELSKVPYLSKIVIGLDRADESQYRHALEYFSVLPQPHAVLWNDGPRLQSLDAGHAFQGAGSGSAGQGVQCLDVFWFSALTRCARFGGLA